MRSALYQLLSSALFRAHSLWNELAFAWVSLLRQLLGSVHAGAQTVCAARDQGQEQNMEAND